MEPSLTCKVTVFAYACILISPQSTSFDVRKKPQQKYCKFGSVAIGSSNLSPHHH
ncbi:hypothetical protein EGR_07964 [Echinococcus granulosus]|uniref:Uncharacterized protein n=1 Tax=Echinococcus granulosus TaxID=6210 RepID=W6UG76_ECHGR|nr:hypothetical protein EGR_07964 [Echinococcus granulosus]EUB57147.1 hypothetical protein EGR_07964 [Echinococcus granulosus]